MPVFRYFVVMGCCLLALIFAAGWVWPDASTPQSVQTPVAAANIGSATASIVPADNGSASFGSLADWRRSEDRLDRKKHAQAIVYPDVATLAPTADRLQWEHQLRYLPENHIYEARAEMPKTIEPPKLAEKKAPVHKHIARTQTNARLAANVEQQSRPAVARTNSWDPFGLFD